MAERVLVAGLGLLGGSFARALRRARPDCRILGLETDPVHGAQARALGLVEGLWDPGRPGEPFDRVFLAVPPSAMASVLEAIRPGVGAQTLVMDACSVKGPVLRAMAQAFPGHGGLVPAHPIAGSHASGPASADPALFEGRQVVLSPLPSTEPWALTAARKLWCDLGAGVREMEAEDHDRTLALLSHLPHLAAFALAGLASGADLSLAGPGFRDSTRLARCPPGLWADIALANREALGPLLEAYAARLIGLKALLDGGDRAGLQKRLMNGALGGE